MVFLRRLLVATAEYGVKLMVLLGRRGVQGGSSPTWLKRQAEQQKRSSYMIEIGLCCPEKVFHNKVFLIIMRKILHSCKMER